MAKIKFKLNVLGNTKKRICKCIICKNELVVYSKKHSMPYSSVFKNRTHQYSDSNDGVLFIQKKGLPGVWFCNDCWNKIISKIKFKV